MRRTGLSAAFVLLAAASAVAAESSVTDGQRAYQGGRFTAARTIWSGLAAAGNADAAFGLGTLYELGNGVPIDPVTAVCWYRRAAAGGLAAAAFNVAVMYDSGRGAPHDAALAARWYARAAALGFHRAEFNLGQLYEMGEGVPRNPGLAAAWYRLAAAAGLTAAADRAAALRPVAPTSGAEPLHPVSVDTPADPTAAPDRQPATVPLTWSAPAQNTPVSYYLEVVGDDAASRRPVFSASTDLSAGLATLPPGRYAARVFALSADSGHYAAGGWTRFEVVTTDALPDCPLPS